MNSLLIISIVYIILCIINFIFGIIKYDKYHTKSSILEIISPIVGIILMLGVIMSQVLTVGYLFAICYSLSIFTIPGMLFPWIYKNNKPNPNKKENKIIKYSSLGVIILMFISYILIGTFV